MRAEVFRGKDGWRFRILGDNGETIAQSEQYSRRIDAVHSAKDLIPEGSPIEIEGEDDA